jgi:DNA-directed RNA polymerase subunit beta'
MAKKKDEIQNRDRVVIKIASPDVIRSWSSGVVKKAETLNYRTLKPEKDGLFCEKIFGPVRDWECNCGKYKGIKFKGITCDRCGITCTRSSVRRERMGHVELACPVTHIWFYKAVPSRLSALLQIGLKDLEKLIYYEEYIVIDPGDTPLKKRQFLFEDEYQEALVKYGGAFKAKIGAEAVRDLLKELDLKDLSKKIRKDLEKSNPTGTNAKKLARTLKIVEDFRASDNIAEWMVLDVLPVIPPDLRPLVPLEGGRFATSDLNDLYRRVINRNNRLKKLMDLKAPEIICRNEKRMLQEAVDALLDNGRHGRPVLGSGNRPLKSLSDMLKGKQGRFRMNLLGKRVDYSGRSVIVVGPELKLHQCGLPKKMALELFEPFIIRKLREKGFVHTIKGAKRMVERAKVEVWDILDEVIKDHPVMLNRAPTLHRLSIQAFYPVLVEGKAIKLHPLVCAAFNADFDGDQMAVHVPLSIEAQIECRIELLSINNLFSPADGRPVVTPSQDVVLGLYYLTKEEDNPKEDNRVFTSKEEAIIAHNDGFVKMHQRIKLKLDDTVWGEEKPSLIISQEKALDQAENKASEEKESEAAADSKEDQPPKNHIIETTVGRVLFNELLPPKYGFVNELLDKKKIGAVISDCYKRFGQNVTIQLLDDMKNFGFTNATLAGISIGMGDLTIPKEKDQILKNSKKEIAKVKDQYRKGIITGRERYNKIIDVWTHTTEVISDLVFQQMAPLNPVCIMANSGARGSKLQIRQLSGMRGLMAKPSGEIIENPITASFREGLTVLEYFISTHGARKGLADTALKTADAGYLTRRLVDVAQEMVITEDDCQTLNGITVSAIVEGDELVVSLKERIIGRVALDTIVDIVTDRKVVEAGEVIDEETAEFIEHLGIEKVRIRSVLTCEAERGLCVKCYGRNLATQRLVEVGESVGTIAAQSIGEPGTQLTMRTFHIGGTASRAIEQSFYKAKNKGTVKYHQLRVVAKDKEFIVLNRNGSISINNEFGREYERYQLPQGAVIKVPDGGTVKKDSIFVSWDPYTVPIITEVKGVVNSEDLIPDVTVQEEHNPVTGIVERVVVEHKQEYHPQIIITDDKDEIVGIYSIPLGAHILVKDQQEVKAGDLIAKIPRGIGKTRDITGGLPRVAELFEARKPKDPAIISEIDGVVEFGQDKKGRRTIIVKSPTGMSSEYTIPHGKHPNVYKGDRVFAGQQLTDGPVVPHDILRVCGDKVLQEYLLNEVQEVYRLQGVRINDKHIELIISQMLKKVKIEDPGDTNFLMGEQVNRVAFKKENEAIAKKKGKPAKATPLLLGITKVSLTTDSFISSASFQETTRVLTEAASSGKIDFLCGLKENVIVGHLIPAGSGLKQYNEVEMVKYADNTTTDSEEQNTEEEEN